MSEKITGRCFCGIVRFEVLGPESFACFCYCTSCQHAAGAPVVAWATYPRGSFKITHGEMHLHRSSPGVFRGICKECGSSISYETRDRSGEIDITVICLDEPASPELKAHIWTEDKPAWLQIADDLPIYKKSIE